MRFFSRPFLHPKHWPFALLLMLCWCVAQLPLAWQPSIGRGLGRVLYRIRKVRHVNRCNLRHCYPDLDEAALEKATYESCVELGMSLMETFLVWFRGGDRFIDGRYVIKGGEHLDAAFAEGRGVIALACHHGAVDVNAALLHRYPRGDHKLVATYKATDSIVNAVLAKVRAPYTDKMLSATNLSGVVRTLRRGDIIWYAPDIEVKNKNSVFADFMGQKASTTTAIARLARATNAVVIPCAHYRVDDRFNYVFEFLPPLQHFPTEDAAADTRAVNAAIERIIERYPYRYWWVIKRFKKQPKGVSPVYL